MGKWSQATEQLKNRNGEPFALVCGEMVTVPGRCRTPDGWTAARKAPRIHADAPRAAAGQHYPPGKPRTTMCSTPHDGGRPAALR
jgi:hypothetical protein